MIEKGSRCISRGRSSNYSWQDLPDTGRSTGAYIIFYQGGAIDNHKHVPRPVAQTSA